MIIVMQIPVESLPSDTLHNIIEAFILREGTDYGAEEVPIADKVAQVKEQLTRGKLILVYSELHETVNILPVEQFTG